MPALDQHQFVKKCLEKYKTTPLPPGECWEQAHYPKPACLGGESVVLLWSRDHALQGVLQSEEYQHPCLHSASEHSDRRKLSENYPEFLPLFEKWLRNLKALGGAACLEKHPWIRVRGGLSQGAKEDNNLVRLHDRRSKDPDFDKEWKEHQKRASAAGGKVSGPLNKGLLYCNNGEVEKKYRPEEGLPEGFVPGRLDNGQSGTRWCNNGKTEGKYHPEEGLPVGFVDGRLFTGSWCNNGKVTKKYYPEVGLPEGFTPGRLRKQRGGQPHQR